MSSVNKKDGEKKSSRILLLTGHAAEPMVRSIIERNNLSVKVLPINVAAFITTDLILEHLLTSIIREEESL